MFVDMWMLNILIGMKGKRKFVFGIVERMFGCFEGLLKGEDSVFLFKRLWEEGYD